MKTVRLMIILSAFLIMISSVFSLMQNTDRTAVYLNVGAMFCLMVAVTFLNFKNKNSKEQ